MSSGTKDFYEILGVGKDASAQEIKKAFRQKAKQLHPDTNKDPNADEQFKDLGEAYDVLSDPQKRQVYDQYGADGLKGAGYQTDWGSFQQGFPDMGDIFSAFFGQGFGGQRHGPRHGDDLRTVIQLDFLDAVFGVDKKIDVAHLEHCEPCGGSGSNPGTGPSTCTDCGGQGQVRQTAQTILGQFTQIVTCPRCQGRGQMITDPCRDCSGHGRREVKKELDLTIPAGVDEGTQLRVAGEGNAGPMGGPSGDLYVVLAVKPHELFERNGYDVYSKLEVTYPQLAIGDQIEIPLLQGTETIKIPAGTANGHVFTLKEKGVPMVNNPSHRGNFYVRVEVVVPTKLSKEEKELLGRLAEIQEKPKSQTEMIQNHASSIDEGMENNTEKGSFFNKFRQALNT